MPEKSQTSFRHCFTVAAVFFLFCLNPSQKCSAEPAQVHQYITVPFTALRSDNDLLPHQLITVQIRGDKPSPAVFTTFLFDTGTTHCAISSRLAAKLGLSQHPMRQQSGQLLKFNGAVTPSVTVASLDVGTLHVQGFDLAVLPKKQFAIATNQAVDGILGANFWSAFATRIDFTHNQITFITPFAKTLSHHALNHDAVKLSSSEIARMGFKEAMAIPVVLSQGQPFTLAALGNGRLSTRDLFLIDSGSNGTFLSTRAIQKLGLKTVVMHESTNIYGSSLSAETWLPTLSCFNLKLRDSLVLSVKGLYSVLGLDVLANYDVLLDFPQQKIYLKPRGDLQSVTSRQYEMATQTQQRQWAEKRLMVTYPNASGTFGFVVPYSLTPDGLPLAQVRPNPAASPSSFLLKTNTHNIFLSSELAHQWRIAFYPALDDAGKPQLLLHKESFSKAKLLSLFVGGADMDGDVVILPPDRLLSWTSYSPVSGIIGAAFIYAHPILMNPKTQTWTSLNHLEFDDLPGLGMADAAVVDILDPDSNFAIQVQQGNAQFDETSTLATGSSFTLLSAKAAQFLKLTPEPQKLTYGAGKDITVFNQAHLSQISIGGVVLKDVLVAYPVGAMPDGFYPRLGMNVISQLLLLVDAPAKKMYVKKAGS